MTDDMDHRRKDRARRGYDWQGVRLALLGIGVLAVLGLVVVFTFDILGKGVGYLVDRKVWPLALSAFVFAGLTGIASVVRAFAAPMGKVVEIVERRKKPPEHPADEKSS